MVFLYNCGETATLKLKLLLFDTLTQKVREQSNTGKHCRLACFIHYRCVDDNSWLLVEVSLDVPRNRRLIRDGSPGRPPRLSHSS